MYLAHHELESVLINKPYYCYAMQVVVGLVLLRMVRLQTTVKARIKEWRRLLQTGQQSGSKSTVLLSGLAAVWLDTHPSRSRPDFLPLDYK